MPFTIIRQDITELNVDAVVNAANTSLAMGGGVCGAIFRAAGEERMTAACRKRAPIRTGEAAITPGFALGARYVIHAVGPVYHPEEAEECERLLRRAYESALLLAKKRRCGSVAFPLISSGIFGYPKAEALRVASAAIQEFLRAHDMDVYLTVFGREAFAAGQQLMGAVESYIDDHYAELHDDLGRRQRAQNASALPTELSDKCPRPAARLSEPTASSPMCPKAAVGLDELMERLDESFSQTLLRLIDAKGRTDVEVYKRANLDRKLFSKIRKGKGYVPSKRTALALAVALELNLSETDDLLERAGYALSHSRKFDVIVEYFIVNRHYDIYEINEVLFQYDEPLLGS